jgi:hypothetical protein
MYICFSLLLYVHMLCPAALFPFSAANQQLYVFDPELIKISSIYVCVCVRVCISSIYI